MPVIKRYSNRKLYNSETRQYVTLDDIGEMIRLGEEVQVVDHDTGADLTAVTLAQVIFEQEKKIGGLLPQVLLTRLIRARESTFSGLRQAFHSFLDPQGFFEREISRRLSLLVDRSILSSEERQRLETLLLDPALSPDQEEVNPEEIQSLLEKIRLLEQEIDRLQQLQN